MVNSLNSNDQIINSINQILIEKKECVINIVNDKLTLSVFSLLEQNLHNVKEINLIIRDTQTVPNTKEIFREFDIESSPSDLLFNDYDIVQKNKLVHFSKAKSMYEFIKSHVNIRKTRPNYQIKGNVILIDEDFMIQGSSSLEISERASKGQMKIVNFDTMINASMDKDQIVDIKKRYEQIWHSQEATEDYKEEILKSLNYVYKEHPPEFLYYFTLNELFGSQLDHGIEKFEQDNNHFKKTKIWNMLFDFQKDAVLSAIQKISKFNGCIIADSVGLGKTFEALAVIKYFELRQDNVLVLTPAKLYDNWNSFKGAYKDSLVDEVFNYKIMFHTDLSRYKGDSKSGWDLSRFDWTKFDLIVIDESHNFRNRTEKDEGFTRYQRLLQEVIKKNLNTKVLLLSATPVNNSLTDLKNQISIITADRDFAFEDEGIASVDNLLRRTTAIINTWDKEPMKDKKELFDRLPSEFYKLLEMITISRSRKHITNYYGSEEVKSFPEKLKPDTYTPDIDTRKQFLNFEETNITLESLKLAVYTPMAYIKSVHKLEYQEKYQSKSADGRVLLSNELREFGTKTLHRFNLFKRLESSVFSFSETIRRLIERIDNYIMVLEKNDSSLVYEDNDDSEGEVLDYKYAIHVKHLNLSHFLEDLYYDKHILDGLYKDIQTVLDNDRDQKLHVLLNLVRDKVRKTPINSSNKKVLIFTAFADTANYLYSSLEGELKKEGVYSGVVCGSYKPKSNNPTVHPEFNSILSSFSPKSKMKVDLPTEQQIDILIGTDCISEGQNLQDCDCVINYDIQWNPVSLIQRFGRIDRIGSQNNQIKMINFFPNVELNEYLNLEQRVKGKMLSVNITSTGDEDILTPEMNDLQFRKRHLERLREEVVELEEVGDNISLTDLNMNDFLYDLAEYTKRHPEIKQVPRGIYSVTDGEVPGVIFCFKHKFIVGKPKSDSSLYPYYLVYIDNKKNILMGSSHARDILREFRKMSYQKDEPVESFYQLFYKRTNRVKDMSHYSKLLSACIQSIQKTESKAAEQTIFDFGGFNNNFATEDTDDFELISLLVIE
ncbi:helicase-related protein [Peribacillus sp. NPDC096622]|uniref:helicase-related protein n=1 Tax=Peribacillus sp. NPDC096622 TaxID=3364396 RepID=UPI00382BB5FC